MRLDIQVLRAWAVLLVLFDHAGFHAFRAGYLGVDIFFVISGYLITQMVSEKIAAADFSFTDFYLRRAKRLLPAAYVTVFVTTIAAMFLLDQQGFSEFRMQVVGAVTFSSNFILYKQISYFAPSSALKPLLHFWSLAIEEQYYLLLPALLVFIPRRFWIITGISIFSLSLLTCLIAAPINASAVFYLLPTRAWELALGSLGALCLVRLEGWHWMRALFYPALLVLVLLPFFPCGGAHPGIDAMLVCSATLLIIVAKRQELWDKPATRALAKIGDISYSLYLVHWPLMAMVNNCWMEEPPLWVRLLNVLIAFMLAILLYRYVEKPLHVKRLQPSRRVAAAFVCTSLAVLCLPFYVFAPKPTVVDFSQLRRANVGFDVACQYAVDFSPRPECKSTAVPQIMVWGDSFAMHLVKGVAVTSGDRGVIQATRSSCAPMLGLSFITKGTSYTRRWAENCIRFNHSVMRYLQRTPSIDTVVLSSPFYGFFPAPNMSNLVETGNGFEQVSPGMETAVAGLKRTVDALRQAGKKVVLIAPPPAVSGLDVGRCLERQLSGKPLFFTGHNSCEIPRAAYLEKNASVRDFLQRLPTQLGLDVIYLDTFLCDASMCKTYIDKTILYADFHHLSQDGAVLIAQKMSWGKRIAESAR